jgi:hypothetical protein
MKSILLYLWSLPQNLLGLLLRAIYKGYDSQYEDAIVRRSVKMKGGISLGRYIIINQWSGKKTVQHEYGHCIQSRRLGWLYLIVVGLPSIIWAGLYGTIVKRSPNGYYRFWTERRADKLGGVKR